MGKERRELYIEGVAIRGGPESCAGVREGVGGVPPVRWTPERLVGIVRLGGKDAPPCQGDRTFIGRTRRSSGVKLLADAEAALGVRPLQEHIDCVRVCLNPALRTL